MLDYRVVPSLTLSLCRSNEQIMGLNLLNSSGSHEKLEILVLMEAGICLKMEGGWLDFALM